MQTEDTQELQFTHFWPGRCNNTLLLLTFISTLTYSTLPFSLFLYLISSTWHTPPHYFLRDQVDTAFKHNQHDCLQYEWVPSSANRERYHPIALAQPWYLLAPEAIPTRLQGGRQVNEKLLIVPLHATRWREVILTFPNLVSLCFWRPGLRIQRRSVMPSVAFSDNNGDGGTEGVVKPVPTLLPSTLLVGRSALI